MEVQSGDTYLVGDKTIDACQTNDIIRARIGQIADYVIKSFGMCDKDIPTNTDVILTGGGSQLRGIDERIGKETGLSVNVIDDAFTCVCKGAARILEDLDKFRPVLIASLN